MKRQARWYIMYNLRRLHVFELLYNYTSHNVRPSNMLLKSLLHCYNIQYTAKIKGNDFYTELLYRNKKASSNLCQVGTQ